MVSGVPVFGSIAVTEMVIEQLGSKQLVYYWFQTKNRSSHDVNINRFHLALHAIKRDNTHDSLFGLSPRSIGMKPSTGRNTGWMLSSAI